MDALNIVEKDVSKVISKLGNIRQNYIDVFDKLIEKMEGLQSKFNTMNLDEGLF